MNLFFLSWKNLWARPGSTLLSLLLLVLGVGLISFVLHFSEKLENNLIRNAKGTDLVVGAKGSPLQLVLSAVYHIDNPTGNILLADADTLRMHPMIKQSLPLSYGDSYQGFRILGTDTSALRWYDAHLKAGRVWGKSLEIVAGASVAEKLGLEVGSVFFSTHGLVSGAEAHEDAPFKVVGVLAPAGNVLDQLLLTDLSSVWEVHEHEHPEGEEAPHQITALLIRCQNAFGILAMPRQINENTRMMAAVPAFEISRLMKLLGFGAATLRGLAWVILVVSAISVFISLYTSLSSRKYEMALMRTMGGIPLVLFAMVLFEGLWLTLTGYAAGIFAGRVGMIFAGKVIDKQYHYSFTGMPWLKAEQKLLALVIVIGIVAAALPAWQAARTPISETLADA